MQRNPRTLGIEKAPHNPLLANFIPPGGAPYQVRDGDSWKTLAAVWGVDAQNLIYFNFHTNNPDEVNWYLSHRTGCNKPTPDGFNWVFSSSANPGRIYRPPIDFEPEERQAGPQGVNRLARYLDGLDEEKLELVEENPKIFRVHLGITIAEGVHWAHAFLDIFNLAEIGGTVGAGIAGGVLLGGGSFLAVLGVLAEIGLGDLEAIDQAKRSWFIRGFSYGVVTAANGAKNRYINDNMLKGHAFDNSWYPEQQKNFEAAYVIGVRMGIVWGRQLNNAERGRLFKILHAKEDRWSKEKLKNWDNWSPADKRDYYDRMSAQFRGNFMAPL